MLRGRALQFDPKLIDLFGPMISRLRAEHADLDAFLGQLRGKLRLPWLGRRSPSRLRPIEGVESAKQLSTGTYKRQLR